MAIVGVDEAGKGPVLGAMFAAAVRAPDRSTLPDGIDDSKRLTPARRRRLAAALEAAPDISVRVVEIPVDRIDDPGTDMNTLTVEAHAEALSGLASAGDHVLADAADVDPDRFGRRVAARLDDGLSVRGEHRADEHDAVVAAASVAAKVERDAHVARLADDYGDVGSGYAHDPRTRAFLAEYVEAHGEIPECARASWRTSEDAVAAAEQAALDAFVETR